MCDGRFFTRFLHSSGGSLRAGITCILHVMAPLLSPPDISYLLNKWANGQQNPEQDHGSFFFFFISCKFYSLRGQRVLLASFTKLLTVWIDTLFYKFSEKKPNIDGLYWWKLAFLLEQTEETLFCISGEKLVFFLRNVQSTYKRCNFWHLLWNHI